MKTLKTISMAAATAALGLGVVGQAHAQAYSISFLDITQLVVNNTPAANFLPGTTTDTSQVSATLNGAGALNGGPGVVDPLPANAPGGTLARVDNTFNQFGPTGTNTYSNSDSQIPFRQTAGDPYTQALQIGETELNSGRTGSTNTENSSLTGFTVAINIAAPTTFGFDFYADPYMRTMLDANAPVGLSAQAAIQVVFEITDSNGNLVFRWTPDGGLGTGILNGTETADDHTLNTTLAAAFVGDDKVYDPTGLGISTDTTGTGFGHYAAISNSVAAGTYTLALTAKTSTVATVPEPGTLALLGLGLAGLGFAYRRKLV